MLIPTAVTTAVGAASSFLCTLPEFTTATIVITVLQCGGAVVSGIGERTGENAGYSKFFNPSKCFFPVSSRVGMLVIYALGLALSAWWLATAPLLSLRQTLTAWFLLGHYLKREMEVFFVHRYSGSTDLAAACLISTFYALCAWGILAYTPPLPMSSPVALLGTVLYAVGQAGNGYHHWLLRQLRTQGAAKGTKKYVVPFTGCFPLVACPHYFFELVSWWGVAIVSGSLFGFLNFASMCNYLSGRSFATTAWYKAKFDAAYPADRKHIIPFVY